MQDFIRSFLAHFHKIQHVLYHSIVITLRCAWNRWIIRLSMRLREHLYAANAK